MVLLFILTINTREVISLNNLISLIITTLIRRKYYGKQD